jgi:hypothetical protein
VARGEAPVRFVEGPSAVVFERRGADTIGAVVYGPDPRESDLTPASAAQSRAALSATVLEDAAFGAAIYAGIRRADVSGLLLGLALVLAAIETVVAIRTR